MLTVNEGLKFTLSYSSSRRATGMGTVPSKQMSRVRISHTCLRAYVFESSSQADMITQPLSHGVSLGSRLFIHILVMFEDEGVSKYIGLEAARRSHVPNTCTNSSVSTWYLCTYVHPAQTYLLVTNITSKPNHRHPLP